MLEKLLHLFGVHSYQISEATYVDSQTHLAKLKCDFCDKTKEEYQPHYYYSPISETHFFGSDCFTMNSYEPCRCNDRKI